LHSTVAPELARHLATQAKQSGIDLIDVGVSGGGPAAIEGKLSLFVGGEPAAVERARPWLQAIGKSVAYLGPVGRGLQGKLLNNLISIANYGMSAAIVDVGAKLGFDTAELCEALMAGSAQSFALKVSPGWITKSVVNTPARLLDLHDLLKKDVDHARNLLPTDDRAMAALLASCEAMLARLKVAAAQAT
jgi:3-hydroxyisobutyrate dehydrogenase-like beta-hydroxyacid dehydrogenase